MVPMNLLEFALVFLFCHGMVQVHGQQVEVGSVPVSTAVQHGTLNMRIDAPSPRGFPGWFRDYNLAYNAATGRSTAGYGWSLEGLSLITRCPNTYGIDGAVKDVSNSANDFLCFDGQRLVLVAGTYWAFGSVYRTEIDTFNKIVATKSSDGSVYFTIYTRDNYILTFGSRSDSRFLVANNVWEWRLDSQADWFGNKVNLSYTNTGSFAYLSNVTCGDAVIRYNYEARPDVSTSFYAGAAARVDNMRLTSVDAMRGQSVEKSLVLQYSADSYPRDSVLTSVKMCTNVSCLTPTVFSYSGMQRKTVENPTLWTAEFGEGRGWDSKSPRTLADVNNDGFVDIVGFGSQSVFVALNRNGSGFLPSSQFLPADQCSSCFSQLASWDDTLSRQVVDLNGDGLVDLFGLLPPLVHSMLNSGNLRFSGKITVNTGAAGTGLLAPILRDFNGDGLLDIMHRDADTVFRLALSNPDSPGTWRPVVTWSSYASLFSITRSYQEPFFVGDVNADSLPDLVVFTTQTVGALLFSNTGSSFAAPVGFGEFSWSQNWRVEWDKRALADVNNDGMSDLVAVYRNGTTYVALSVGNRFNTSSVWLTDAGISQVDPWNTQMLVQDVNMDALPDLILISKTTVQVALNTGRNSFESPITWLTNHTMSVNATYLADVTGESVPDFVSITPSGVLVAKNRNQPVRVESAVDGLGLETKVVYTTTANGQVYRSSLPTGYSSGTYPMAELNIGQPIVSQVRTDDGVGCWNVTEYTYTSVRYDLTGRSKPAFAKIEESRNDGLEKIVHEYHQTFPLSGVERLSIRRADNNVAVALTHITYAVTSNGYVQPNGRTLNVYVVSMANKVDEQRDLNGQFLTLTTTDVQYDAYGNAIFTNVTVRSASTWYNRQTTITQASADADNWWIDQPICVNYSYAVPDKPKISRSATMRYYSNRKLQTKTEDPDSPIGLVTMYSYDQNGRVIEERKRPIGVTSNVNDRYTSYHYWPGASNYEDFVDRVTNSLGEIVERNTFDTFGNLVSSTDFNELTTTYTYDSWRRKTGEFRPNGVNITIEYALDSSLPLAAYRVVKRETMKPTEVRIFDKLNRLIRTVTEASNGDDVYVDVQYDKFGRKVAQSYPYFSVSDTPAFVHTKYDSLGRVLTQTDNATGSTVRTSYNGFDATTILPGGGKRVSTSDLLGKVLSVIDENGGKLVMSYDAIGNLVSTVDPAGNQATMQYDVRGNKVSLSDPAMGNWTYFYNAFGENVKTIDAKNQVTLITFDQLGRAIMRNDSDANTVFTYNKANNRAGSRIGLSSIESSKGYKRTFEYDTFGQLSSESRLIDGVQYNRTTVYRAQKLVSESYPDSTSVYYCYNTRGFLTAVRSDGNCSNFNTRGDRRDFWRAVAYDADGKVAKERSGNGVTTTYTRDAAGRVLQIQSTYGNILLRNWQYQYDAASNMKTRRDSAPQFNTVEEFRYDALRRLVRARIRDADGDFYEENSEAWSYDATGNILNYQGYNGESLKYSYDPADPYSVTKAGSYVYAYDANGNMVWRNGNSVYWTVDNRLKSIDTPAGRSVSFEYDPQSGLRYRKVLYAGPTATASTVLSKSVYFDQYFESIQSGTNGNRTKTYVYALNQLVAVQTVSAGVANVLYMHSDHLGSVDTITGANGDLIEANRYTAFGRIRRRLSNTNSTEPASSRYFVSHEALNEDGLGLIHMSGRVYDPIIGKFLSPDIVVQSMQNAASYNRYAYCLNNPLSYVDPTGYFFGRIFKAVTNVVKSIFNPKTLVPIVVGALVTAVAGPVAGSIVGGAISGYMSTGTLNGAITGAVIGGVTSGFGSLSNAVMTNAASSASNGVISSIATYATETASGRILTSAVTGGLVATATGGNFADGFANSLVISSASEFYSATVKYGIDARPGAPAVDKTYNQPPVKGVNNIGTQGSPVDPKSWFGEGGRISRGLNEVFGVNAVAGMHDYFQVNTPDPWRSIMNIPMMVPAYAITMIGMMDQTYLYNQPK